VSFDKYVQTQDAIDIIRALAISAVVTGVSLCLTILLAYPAAYAIARVRTRWNQLAEAYFGLGFLIPAFALLVPVFLAIAMIGLLNNPLALILFYPATGLPIAVLILVRYIQTIPVDLDESAAVDGANALEVIRRIIVPLSVPGMVTVAVLNFVGYWNEFLFALVILNTQSRTVQVAVPLLRATRTPDYGLVAAGAIISIVPVFLVFVLLQERIENAFLGGALKG
jgi:multiple sugar transport system permease protein